MNELRKQFEGLENVKDKLKWVYSCNEKYFEREFEYRSSAIWMNGAWYTFQEQQKKIDAVKTILDKIYKETEGDNELLLKYLDEIQELLK